MKIVNASVVAAGVVLMGAVQSWATDPAVLKERNETQEQRDARMEWFRDAKFGMFIHWGTYAVAAGEWDGKEVSNCGEWIQNWRKIPIAEYSKLADSFNPTKYDPEKWVLAAKDAGMKYIVITSKHHEGFAMFDTKASPYNIVEATPYKRDVLRPLVEACRKHGMRIGFYYSQNLDWHHPGGGGGEWDPAHQGDPDQYVNTIALPQVKEILSNYGPIDILWWDISQGIINKARADRLHQAVLDLQPRIIMNNRLGGGYRGDTETPERTIPASGYPDGRDWETCMTMNETWGYKKNDHQWKSTATLIQQLVACASMGGNFLLNVGPTAEGEIPSVSLERMAEIGKWMRVNGESIYGAKPAPFPKAFDWGRVTRKGNILYAHVFKAPANNTITLPLKNSGKKAAFLNGGTPVKMAQSEQGLELALPAKLPDPNDSVIKIVLKGDPELK